MPFVTKVIFLFLLTSSCALGQNFFKKIKYQAESGIFLSTSGKTPFLVRANQYGTVPVESSIFTIRGGAFKDYDSTFTSLNKLNKFGFGFGVDVAANVGKINQLLIPETYVKVRYGAFEIYAGRRKEIIGLVDSVLTSGSFIWSGNALPIPKIQIAIPNYTPILRNGLLSIKGAYSHGFFDNGSVRSYYLHQKYIYARIGKSSWKTKLHAGFNHQVQWGGRPLTPFIDRATGTLVTSFPSDFATYLKVVTGTSLNKENDGLSSGAPANEALNRAGNHLGTLDLGTEFSFKGFDLFLYRQSIYEDGSLFFLNNITDGLLGVSVRRKNVKTGIVRVCFEYLQTTSQGGTPEERYDDIPQLRGVDNYFNNAVYTDGWTYRGNVIGTPLLTPINSVDKAIFGNKNLDQLSSAYTLNRVKAFSLAIEGRGKNIEHYTKLIFNHNLGSYHLPINAKQFSFLYRVKYNLPKFSLVSYISFDEGKLFPTTLGGYLGVQRTFF